jgi:hypothetical protein
MQFQIFPLDFFFNEVLFNLNAFFVSLTRFHPDPPEADPDGN